MASGIGFFVGLVCAGIILLASLAMAIGSASWGAVGYALTIYIIFIIMVGSSWAISVKKNDAWTRLTQIEQYMLHRHRVFFYYPFGAANFAHFCNWTRIFALIWAVFCVWKGWYWLSAILANFYVISTPMITIWLPIPNYQRCVQKGYQWAQDRLNAMQRILDHRDALGF